MKFLYSFLFFCVFTLPAFSQFGVKGGVNSTDLAGYNNVTENTVSVHLGGTYDYQLSNNWFFQPALLYTTVGFKLKDDKRLIKDGQVKIHALEMPLNFSFRPVINNNAKLLTDLGLYTRYGLFGNKMYEYYPDNHTPKVDESPFDAYNRFDIGVNLGIGLQIQQYYGKLSFHRGLSNAEKEISVYHEVFRVSIGYYF